MRGKERIYMEKRWEALDAIFNPKSVAVIGASDNPGKLGSHVMRSLTEGKYPGRIFPVNPGREEIFGIKTYPSLLHIPDEADLSVILLPAEQVPKTILEKRTWGQACYIAILFIRKRLVNSNYASLTL